MKINMDDSRIITVAQLKKFLDGSQQYDLSLRNDPIEERYQFIDRTVDRLEYCHLRKKDKRVVIKYLRKVTGYQPAQLHRLIKRAIGGELLHKDYRRSKPHRKYLAYDIKLLEKTDELHLRLNSLATKEILRREVEVFGQEKYAKIAQVSPSHINNLRHSTVYRNHWVNHTQARQVPIGLTQPPENRGRPGSLRVDTVHQREVYHINSVDEITQWEIVICVPQITEEYMLPALEEMIDQYPFVIFNFHSDRGGESINYQVANWLNRLLIKQTKNRSSHPNDNALVETKNGHVIRKNMGWQPIRRDLELVESINRYYRGYFNPYLNYHRPSVFSTRTLTYPNGRVRKVYDQAIVPYEKLKEVSCQQHRNFLKPGVTFAKLDEVAYTHSDNQFAQLLREQERVLFNKIYQH